MATCSSTANANAFEIVGDHQDAAVSGADPATVHKGFIEMLTWVTTNSFKTILIQSPRWFARDLAMQHAGHDSWKVLALRLTWQKSKFLLGGYADRWARESHAGRHRPVRAVVKLAAVGSESVRLLTSSKIGRPMSSCGPKSSSGRRHYMG